MAFASVGSVGTAQEKVTGSAGSNTVWHGETDAFGVARDDGNSLPFLDPGTYYFWSQKSGYSFTNPDEEVVS